MSVLYEEEHDVLSQALHIKRVEGALRWFDYNKGYGFIVPSDGSPDVLLHNDILKGVSLNKLKPGMHIECEIVKSSKGLLATKILNILDDISKDVKETSKNIESMVSNSPMQLSIVKWYDEKKGYGFAVTHFNKGDVMLSRKILRKNGIRSLISGDKLNIRIGHGKHGLIAEYVEYLQED